MKQTALEKEFSILDVITIALTLNEASDETTPDNSLIQPLTEKIRSTILGTAQVTINEIHKPSTIVEILEENKSNLYMHAIALLGVVANNHDFALELLIPAVGLDEVDLEDFILTDDE